MKVKRTYFQRTDAAYGYKWFVGGQFCSRLQPETMQKRLKWSKYRLGYGVGWARETKYQLGPGSPGGRGNLFCGASPGPVISIHCVLKNWAP